VYIKNLIHYIKRKVCHLWIRFCIFIVHHMQLMSSKIISHFFMLKFLRIYRWSKHQDMRILPLGNESSYIHSQGDLWIHLEIRITKFNHFIVHDGLEATIPDPKCVHQLTRSQVTGWNPLEDFTKSSCGKLRLGGTLPASNSRKG